MNKRTILFGDSYGISSILNEAKPNDSIVGIVAAERRPQYFDKIKSLSNSINVPFIIQPFKINKLAYNVFLQDINNLLPDSIFCYSYSMKIPEDVISMVNLNAFNLHESFLPYNRGPNSENWAIIKGEQFSGATIHVMDTNFDTGDILFQERVEIDIKDTWITLLKKTNLLSQKLLREKYHLIMAENYSPIKQDESIATKNFRLNQDYPLIDFKKMDDYQIYNLIRAQVFPLKGAYIENEGNRTYFNEFLEIEDVAKLRIKHGQNK